MHRAISCGLFAVLLAACSDGMGPPGPPATVTLLSGDGQEGQVGTTLAQPLVVVVKDAAGRPVPDVTLRWFVTTSWPAGGRAVAYQTVTDASGRAMNRWDLGRWAGEFEMAAEWYEEGMLAPLRASAHARILPGPVAEWWRPEWDSILGLHLGDSLQIEVIGFDEFKNRSTDGDPPQWSASPTGVVSVSPGGLIRALSPGSAVITGTADTGPSLHFRIGVNATTEELVRVPPHSNYWTSILNAIDGAGSEILVVGGTTSSVVSHTIGGLSLWRLRGSAVAEVHTEPPPFSVSPPRDVAVEEGGRSWLVPGKTELLLGAGSVWQTIYEPPVIPWRPWHLAVSGAGGIWMTHPQYSPAGPILLRHDGTTQTRYQLSETLSSALVAEDGAGNVYLAGQADGRAYLARWDDGRQQRLTVPADYDAIMLLRGARGAGITWAVGRSYRRVGDGEATAMYDLFRLQASHIETIPDPLGGRGYGALEVRRDGVPYLARKRQVTWLENGTWRTHWLEAEGWETGNDLYVDDTGVIYLLLRRNVPNAGGGFSQNHRVESGVLIIRP